jgi:hypothetical protein
VKDAAATQITDRRIAMRKSVLLTTAALLIAAIGALSSPAGATDRVNACKTRCDNEFSSLPSLG